MPGIGWPGLAFGCVTALGIFFRSIFDISSFLLLGFANQSGNARERQPQKAVAANLPDERILNAITQRLEQFSLSLPLSSSSTNGMREFGF